MAWFDDGKPAGIERLPFDFDCWERAIPRRKTLEPARASVLVFVPCFWEKNRLVAEALRFVVERRI